MKQPIITAMRRLTSAYILSMLLWQTSSASEHATTDDQPTTLTYNAEATAELQEVFNAATDFDYSKKSPIFRQLVEEGQANPNIKKIDQEFSLLYKAVLHNDIPFVTSLLDHRADPNPPGNAKPIFAAKSVEVAKLLMNANKNDKKAINASNFFGRNVLHDAALYGAPAEMITFWCETGVDLHLKDRSGHTPLQRLLITNYATEDRIAAFLWAEANFTSKDEEEAIKVLTKHSPEMTPTFKTLITVVPQVKIEKYRPLLTHHLNRDIAPLVMGYTSPLYDVRYFEQDIESRMRAMLAAEEASTRISKRIKVSP